MLCIVLHSLEETSRHTVFSVLISRPNSLLAIKRGLCVFLYSTMLFPTTLPSSDHRMSQSPSVTPGYLSPSQWLNMKCIKRFFAWTLLQVTFKHSYINLTSFIRIPNSMMTPYNILLLTESQAFLQLYMADILPPFTPISN